jgi:hypothetical protein
MACDLNRSSSRNRNVNVEMVCGQCPPYWRDRTKNVCKKISGSILIVVSDLQMPTVLVRSSHYWDCQDITSRSNHFHPFRARVCSVCFRGDTRQTRLNSTYIYRNFAGVCWVSFFNPTYRSSSTANPLTQRARKVVTPTDQATRELALRR